jgi:hypothetical protein
VFNIDPKAIFVEFLPPTASKVPSGWILTNLYNRELLGCRKRVNLI